MKLSKVDADRLRTSVQEDLRTLKPENFVMRRLFGAPPFIFNSVTDYLEWKIRLAKILSADPYGIALIGSACTGISLHPYKSFKAFDDSSDIDVAVVSGFRFDQAWRYLREIGAGKYKLDRTAIAALKEHTENNVFWGIIATDKLLQHLPFGREWILSLSDFSKQPPINGRDLKIRVYRDTHSLVSYHLAGCRLLEASLLTANKGA